MCVLTSDLFLTLNDKGSKCTVNVHLLVLEVPFKNENDLLACLARPSFSLNRQTVALPWQPAFSARVWWLSNTEANLQWSSRVAEVAPHCRHSPRQDPWKHWLPSQHQPLEKRKHRNLAKMERLFRIKSQIQALLDRSLWCFIYRD